MGRARDHTCDLSAVARRGDYFRRGVADFSFPAKNSRAVLSVVLARVYVLAGDISWQHGDLDAAALDGRGLGYGHSAPVGSLHEGFAPDGAAFYPGDDG